MAKTKAVAKNPRTTSKKKRQPLAKKSADAQKQDKRLSRRKRSGLHRYDQTLTLELYEELKLMAAKAEIDFRVFVEARLRDSPVVKKHLKENDLELPKRPARGNPAAKKAQ